MHKHVQVQHQSHVLMELVQLQLFLVLARQVKLDVPIMSVQPHAQVQVQAQAPAQVHAQAQHPLHVLTEAVHKLRLHVLVQQDKQSVQMVPVQLNAPLHAQVQHPLHVLTEVVHKLRLHAHHPMIVQKKNQSNVRMEHALH